MRHTSLITPILLGCLTWGLAGCTLVPAFNTLKTVEKQASLELAVSLPRSTQAIREDITAIAATVSVPGFSPATSSHAMASESILLDLNGLPAGYANVEVQALNQNTPIGSGSAQVLLVNGARSFIGVTLNLDSSGKSQFLPFSPLTPLATDTINAGRLDALLTGYYPGSMPTVCVERQIDGANFSYVQERVPTSQGLLRFANLSEGIYRLRYSYPNGEVTNTPPTVVSYACSDPVEIWATQSVVPTASLNLAWDLTKATPSVNTQVATRTLDFAWPEKPGVVAPDYYLEVGAFVYNPLYGYSEWTTFDDLRTSATHVAYTLPETASGLIYYRLKYVAGNGAMGGNNYYGGSPLIPFYVQIP